MRPIITIVVVLLCMGALGPEVQCEENAAMDEAKKDEPAANLVDARNLTCPVSEDDFDSEDTVMIKVEYNGKTYNVCSEPCARHFRQFPDKFIKLMERQ